MQKNKSSHSPSKHIRREIHSFFFYFVYTSIWVNGWQMATLNYEYSWASFFASLSSYFAISTLFSITFLWHAFWWKRNIILCWGMPFFFSFFFLIRKAEEAECARRKTGARSTIAFDSVKGVPNGHWIEWEKWIRELNWNEIRPVLNESFRN